VHHAAEGIRRACPAQQFCQTVIRYEGATTCVATRAQCDVGI
jgi:hypothetical protein